jgi:alkylation response protein AidB-like acyl-CoA dehydrogenase
LISFELSEEQKIAQAMVQDLARSVLWPASRPADESAAMPDSILAEIWATGIIQAQAQSGSGADAGAATLNAILLEELAAADASFAIAAAATIGFLSAIAAQGSAAQKQAILPLFAGDAVRCAAVAIMEPGFNFDVSTLRTRAAAGANGYRLSGTKSMVPLAGRSSHFLVIAAHDGRADAFIVPRDAKGVSVAAANPKLGLRALELATVTFDGAAVDASARLGEGLGCDVQAIVDSGRAALAAIMTGISRAVLDYVLPYAQQRVVHGEALARKQVMAFRLADMRTEIDAMRWMTWKAAAVLERRRDARRDAQLAYTYAGEQAMWIADEGMQMLGGHGFLRDHPVEMWYRNVRTLSILEGAAGI